MNPTFPFKKITVELTAQDCADGIRGEQCYCVISTALARMIPEASIFTTNLDHVEWSIDHDGTRYRIQFTSPPEVQEYIRAFDAGEVAHPMTFTLENPFIVEKASKSKKAARTPSKPKGIPKTRITREFGAKTFKKVGA
jgi:hypothetical protein